MKQRSSHKLSAHVASARGAQAVAGGESAETVTRRDELLQECARIVDRAMADAGAMFDVSEVTRIVNGQKMHSYSVALRAR